MVSSPGDLLSATSDDEILNRTGTGYAPGTHEYDLDLIHWYRKRIATPPAQAADSVLEDAARWTTEQEHAIRQGHEIAASDGYFEARPQIDSNARRKVFQAGFERGWGAARAAQKGGA